MGHRSLTRYRRSSQSASQISDVGQRHAARGPGFARRPGSALFLVWQQERNGQEVFGDFQFGRNTGALFREPARNIFLVKATYWIGS